MIDESIRDDHLSVNGYERSTTPYLEELQQRGMLYNWGEASAGATNSWQANALLLTGLNALPDRDGLVKRTPTLYQYAKAMGYTTYYFDAGSSYFWNGTFDDLQYIDHRLSDRHFIAGPLFDMDMLAARHIRQIVSESTGNFIVLNKRGVHFYYNRAFPETAPTWSPIMTDPRYEPDVHDKIVNSYDSGIRYNLEAFFRVLVDDAELPKDTVIVYTSDHGQTLAEEGATWSHGNVHRSEARVPLLLISGERLEVDTAYKASHSNLFATLLDLMEFPVSERTYPYALSLLQAQADDSRPRTYAYGAIDGKGAGGIGQFDFPALPSP